MGSPIGDSPWTGAQCFFIPPPAKHDFLEDRTCMAAEHVHVMPFFLE